MFLLFLYLMTEYSLHSEIKDWYKVSGDKLEVKVEDFIVDVLRGSLLIEIQTGNFSALKKKLAKLLLNNQVQVVYPIAKLKWIVHVTRSGEFVRRRKSPKKGNLLDLFHELVHAPSLIKDRNFSLEVLLIEEEELRCYDGLGSWRRRGVSVKDRKLMNVFDRVVFENSQDFLELLPKELDGYFTNKVLALELGISISLAQKTPKSMKKTQILCRAQKSLNILFADYFELSVLCSFCRLSNMTPCPLPSKTSRHELGTALTILWALSTRQVVSSVPCQTQSLAGGICCIGSFHGFMKSWCS